MHTVILPLTPSFKFLSGDDSRGDPERGSGSRQRAWHPCSWKSSRSVTQMRTQAWRGDTCQRATASKQLKTGPDAVHRKWPRLHVEEPKSQFSKSAFTVSQRSLLVTSFISLSKIHTSVVWDRITFLKCGLAWNLTVKESWIRLKTSLVLGLSS